MNGIPNRVIDRVWGQGTCPMIVKMQCPLVVYVLCNPATLARDLKYLADVWYVVQEVQLVDMFPHTGHVEAIILMTRSGLGEKK